ncbi:virulence factor [Collimonas sp. PA-H2]|uniref:virulence factor n=1 Tax=Collimonas sp. PA-H2 TaxID=1881062 RepID=UPI000BF8A0F2|nr:virulence factor [Collimonas sp. PA-H2]
MNTLIATRNQRLGWTVLAFLIAIVIALWFTWRADAATLQPMTVGELMTRFLAFPAFAAVAAFGLLTAFASTPIVATANAATPIANESSKPFLAQVVGVQWLNPLQRRDYPTEWQLLWTLGLAQPNKHDDMVKAEPEKFTKLQTIGSIAAGNDGEETFKGYHHKYVEELIDIFHDNYGADSRYFYNVHSLGDKSTWRELAGIHIEYALPAVKLDPVEAGGFLAKYVTSSFEIGNTHAPSLWTRNTPPDVRVTMGGPNAGFTSLAAALDYLQAHPNETVWAMNWDAPSRPKDKQINENMVLLVLAGPTYNTERAALAWIGYPATKNVADFNAEKGKPPRTVQAWKATIDAATHNAGKQDTDIGYVIHDANNTNPNSSDRIGNLAQTLSTELPEFDFAKQTFNTPALLGEMGAGTALTNVALGIAYANHFGKNVLIAGTSDVAHSTAVLVTPPAKVRPIDPEKPWFRARGENNAYLPWWGIRHDAPPGSQGYSK